MCITGGAGYVGEMLCDQLSRRADVTKIIAIDKEPRSEWSQTFDKVTYVQHNLADDGWQEIVNEHQPHIIIHTAWEIRTMYGQPAEQWRWNVEGSRKVFEFALHTPGVERLLYFSTASSYSARADNTFEHAFTEAEGFRDDSYLYAHEKKATEELLKELYDAEVEIGRTDLPQVTVVRPAAITGPRGRYMRTRFGLQSALQGNLKGGMVNKLITLMTSRVPATRGWVRQFIHEDDVADIVETFSFDPYAWNYSVFNITPTGEPVYAPDMAAAVGKKILPITSGMARLAFAVLWHGTRGRIPTSPGSWRFYSYPVIMSGDKLAQVYQCRYSSKDAFQYTDGRYEDWVPKEQQRSAPASN